VSERGSILGGGRRPDTEEKWTHNLKQYVPRSGSSVLIQIKETLEVKLYYARWSVCCLRTINIARFQVFILFYFFEGPRSRCYGRTAALRLIVQPCDEDD
jgi:hypothetical protein